MRPPPLLIAIIVSLAALLAAGLAAVSADESIETNEPVDPAVVILQPGENLVGWLGDPLPVAQLKQRIPAIESVSAWEPLTAEFYEPTNLAAGQGYIVTLAGTESVQWRRPMMPVKGKVTLHRGRNLVTWLGSDDWTIDRVALGIGRALVRAEWKGGVYTPAEATTSESLPTLKRGAALWVEVSRTVHWLQPAGLMPTIVFAGEISADIKVTVRRDSIDIMNWFAEEYGVQPDGSILSLYIATDPDLLVEAMEKDGHNTDGIHRSWYRSEGWADESYVVQKAEQWSSDHRNNTGDAYGGYTYGRRILVHEYYHVVQTQMGSSDAAVWLVEGDAQWVRARFVLRDTKTAKNELAEDRQHISSADVRPLKVIEIRPESYGWEYSLGTVAAHQLAAYSGLESLLEFWRALLPEPLGPLGRWQTNPPWQATFEDVFGISVDDFYNEFASWRSELAPVLARGRIIGPDGAGLPYVKIVGRTEHLLEEGGHSYFETSTDGNGDFELESPGTGGVQWGVDLGGCTVYYTSSGAVYNWEHAETLMPSSGGVERVSMALTNETCVWRINGVLVGPNGKPLTDVRVLAESESARVGDSTDTGGVFEIAVPLPDLYRLSIWLDEHDCRVYYRRGDPAGSWNQATQANIEDRDVSGLKFQLVDGLCSLKITGQLLDSNGVPIPDVSVWANSDDGGHGSAGTDSDGRFSVAISEPGRFRVAARIDGCTVFHRRGGVTSLWDRATLVRVSSKDVSDITLQLADGMCERRISGRLLNPDGSPHANQWVRASGRQGSGGAHSGADGSFAFAVPASGTFLLETDFAECRIRHSNRGPTEHWNSAAQIRVSNADVTGIEFRLPEDPATFCD